MMIRSLLREGASRPSKHPTRSGLGKLKLKEGEGIVAHLLERATDLRS